MKNLGKALQHKIFKNFLKNDGVTLIEVSIILIVLGLIALPILRAVQFEHTRNSYFETRGLLAQAEAGINQYYGALNNTTPCPASLALGPGDVDYGVSGDCTLTNVRNCTDPAWFTNEGICRTSGTFGNAVIIGALPFATLRITEEASLDFWSNKLIYAVDHGSTDLALTSGQAISTIGLPPGSATPITLANFQIFIFSTGESQVGGYSRDGSAHQPCGNVFTGYEHENCNFDAVFFQQQNAFSRVAGTTFYDDLTRGQISFPEGRWFEHDGNTTDPDNDFAITLANRVGIGTQNPSQSLDVEGSLRIESLGGGVGGRLEAENICDSTENSCFEVEDITGARPEMRCDPSNQFEGDQVVLSLNGIGIGPHVECSAVNGATGTGNRPIQLDTTIFTPINCPTGSLVGGINASGDIVCVVVQ